MIKELKENYSYAKVIAFLSVFAFIFGVAVCFASGIFLPLASGFLAALILFENPDKRIFSYICPLASIVCSYALIGPVALFGIEHILLAVILAVCYKKSLSKAETAVYLTALITAIIVLSLYVNTAIAIGDFAYDAVVGYTKASYASLRGDVIATLSEFTVTASDGTAQNLMSVENASLYVNVVTNSFVSVIVIFAFVLVGICEKIYSTIVLRYSKHGILKTFAHFLPSNFCAYTYIAAVILGMFASDTTALGIAITNSKNILFVVFLYMGLKYLIMVARASNKKLFIYSLIALGFISFTSVVPTVVSYLGTWVVIGTNAHNKKTSN